MKFGFNVSSSELADLIHDEDLNGRQFVGILDKNIIFFRLADDKIDIDGILRIINYLANKKIHAPDLVDVHVCHLFLFVTRRNR